MANKRTVPRKRARQAERHVSTMASLRSHVRNPPSRIVLPRSIEAGDKRLPKRAYKAAVPAIDPFGFARYYACQQGRPDTSRA